MKKYFDYLLKNILKIFLPVEKPVVSCLKRQTMPLSFSTKEKK
jgi:hypothetical protein